MIGQQLEQDGSRHTSLVRMPVKAVVGAPRPSDGSQPKTFTRLTRAGVGPLPKAPVDPQLAQKDDIQQRHRVFGSSEIGIAPQLVGSLPEAAFKLGDIVEGVGGHSAFLLEQLRGSPPDLLETILWRV